MRGHGGVTGEWGHGRLPAPSCCWTTIGQSASSAWVAVRADA
ncbi:hypothetical protein [Rouxiella badensis]